MSIIDNIKDAAKLVNGPETIELYSKILGIQSEAMELQDENKKLKEELKNIEDTKELEKRLKFEKNVYYKDCYIGPFCSRCWDVEKKLVRLIEVGVDKNSYKCPSCNTHINLVRPQPAKEEQSYAETLMEYMNGK